MMAFAPSPALLAFRPVSVYLFQVSEGATGLWVPTAPFTPPGCVYTQQRFNAQARDGPILRLSLFSS